MIIGLTIFAIVIFLFVAFYYVVDRSDKAWDKWLSECLEEFRALSEDEKELWATEMIAALRKERRR